MLTLTSVSYIYPKKYYSDSVFWLNIHIDIFAAHKTTFNYVWALKLVKTN